MEKSENVTAPEILASQTDKSNGNAYLYVLIVLSFYGVFLSGLMLGYFRSKRREKRRSNVFTLLVHEEEQREWGALRKKHSITPPAVSGLRDVQVSLPFSAGSHGPCDGRDLSPLACALCSMEQSSVSSLSSAADVHFAIEEESDGGTADRPGVVLNGSLGNGDDSAETQREHACDALS